MALSTDKIAETFLNIVAATPIDCDWPLYAEDEVVVVYGQASLEAVYPTDFTVTLSPPNYNLFQITPTAALLTKINNLIAADTSGTEINYITVRRVLDNLTSVQPETVRGVTYLSREVERLWMGVQQVAENVGRSLSLPRKEISGGAVVELPSKSLRPNKALVFDANGDITVSTDDYNDQAADAAASAAAALANKLVTDTNVTTTTANAAAAALAQAAAEAAAAGMKYRNVRVGTTANITLSGTQTIDGVSVVVGNRVLVKDQATQANNGVYVCAAGAWTRATDMDTWLEVPGTVVVVTEGTVNADTVWLCTANDGGTLGSTAVTFVDWGAIVVAGSLALTKLAPVAANTALMNATAGSASATAVALAANQIFGRSSTGNIVAKTVTDDAFNFLAATVSAGQFFAKGSTGNYVAKTISDDALSLLAAANYAAMRTAMGVNGITILARTIPGATTTSLQSGLPNTMKRMTVSFRDITKGGTGDFAMQIGPVGGVLTSGYIGGAVRNGAAMVSSSTDISADASWMGLGAVSGAFTFNLIETANNVWGWTGILYGAAGVMVHSAGYISLGAGNPLERILLTDKGGAPGNFSAGSWQINYE